MELVLTGVNREDLETFIIIYDPQNRFVSVNSGVGGYTDKTLDDLIDIGWEVIGTL